ncbi:phosphoribosyltransferase-like protein [Rubrivirga sp.]|uniref:phosphoribosyltransferase-like protein n=1 Tax=Rubrivirga sp. TaxID=1885344 RepID=UPI003B51A292
MSKVYARKFPGYRPRYVDSKVILDWAIQFPKPARSRVLGLLDHIIYVSEEDATDSLRQLNNRIVTSLGRDGVGIPNIIYIQIDDAGSSSPVMLSMLKNVCNLERLGALFKDSRDLEGIVESTSSLREGAIVYVDDFSATGDQFMKNRKNVSEYITGNFSEFFLAPCLCEEARNKIEGSGVKVVTSLVHTRDERPLRPESDVLDEEDRKELLELSKMSGERNPLGYGGVGSMVVFWRGAPNNTLPLIRGNYLQDRIKGVFPRADHLPPL